MADEIKGRCFVIMPFSKTSDYHTEEYWTKQFEDFVKPIIESHSLTAYRSSPLRGDVLRQIITDLVTAPLVIADLTDANPNVYWELGVRQSFKHCTITIAENGTTLPFDLGIKGTLFYFPKNHLKMGGFRNKLSAAINDCLKNPAIPDSHVLETISGRGTLYQILMKDEAIRKLNAVLNEIKNNSSYLKYVEDTYKENSNRRKEGKGVTYITFRLRVSTLDHLIVNRYIDAPDNFYEVVSDYLDECIRINSQIDFCDLAENSESGESWILEELPDVRAAANSLKKLITKQRKTLSISF